jgi:phosphonate transport system substrate-binding protein
MQAGPELIFQLGYYPWITQNKPPETIRSAVELFASTFEKELQQKLARAKVVVTNPVDVPVQIDRILGNERTIELMNPLGFVFGQLRSQKIEAVAVAQREIRGQVGVTYFAQLYTYVDSGISTVEQAVQKSIGYGVPFSTSNFLIPALELKKKQIHPFFDFTTVKFLGGHDLVAKAVYNKQIVLGAGHDGVIIDLSNQPGFTDAQSKLKTVWPSSAIPSDPVVVNISDDRERNEVAEALIRAGATDDGKRALADFWGNVKGLAAASSRDYDVIKSAIQELRFQPEDLLPKPRRS